MEEKIKHGEERKRISDELKQKPLTKLEREKNSYSQKWLYNLWGPVQK